MLSLRPSVAVIDEQRCIGCAKCLPACPFDAIVGAAQQMHTVLAAECVGCELCVAPCPVDCIAMVPVALPAPAQRRALAAQARRRHRARGLRLARDLREQERLRAEQLAALRSGADSVVAQALARARRDAPA